jgi:bifunctional enzyme CysN/CysC
MERGSAATLMLNDIGQVAIDLDRTIAAVPYAGSRRLGGFILIDKLSHATVAAGMIASIDGGAVQPGEGERGSIRWIAGAGRADYARAADEQARALGRASFVLDEAALERLRGELEFAADRLHAAREIALLLRGAGVDVLITLDVAESDAQPGRRIVASDDSDDISDQWVI